MSKPEQTPPSEAWTQAVDAFSASPDNPGRVAEALSRDGKAPAEVGSLKEVFESLSPIQEVGDPKKTFAAVLERLKADTAEVTHSMTIEDDEGETMTLPLSPSVTTTVGRSAGNLVVLPDRNVSRLHAEITIDGDKLEIADFGRNGTRHNGQLIDEKALIKRGDVVQIGDYRIRFNVSRKATAASEAETIAPASAATELPIESAARLVVVSSNYHGREFHLTREQNIIGRVDADITIDHRSISSWHAKVVREGESYKIVDLGSSNGVIINGEKYRTASLRHNDDIELGHVKLRFVDAGRAFVFEPAVVPPSGSGMGIGIAVAVVLLILIAGGVTVFVVLSQEETPPATSVAPTAAPDTPSAPAATSTGPASDDTAAEVASLTDKGNAAYDEGDWDKAIVFYDMVLEKEPTSAHARERKSMLTKEKPFKRLFEEGKTALSEKRYEDAIRAFRQIPEGASTFADRVKNEGLLETAMNGLMDSHLNAVRDAIKRKKWKEARAALAEARLLDAENSDVIALHKELNKKDRKGAAAEAKAEARAAREAKNKRDKGSLAPRGGGKEPAAGARASGAGGGDAGDGGGAVSEDKKARGAELLTSARKKSLTGDHAGAIADANEALKYGMGFQAHYFLAISYEKIGDNAQAVKHYNAWLKSNCGNKLAEKVRGRITALGGTPSC